MPDQPETFRVSKVPISLLILQILDLYDVPTRFYESLNEQNRMCELRMHVFPNPVTFVGTVYTYVHEGHTLS